MTEPQLAPQPVTADRVPVTLPLDKLIAVLFWAASLGGGYFYLRSEVSRETAAAIVQSEARQRDHLSHYLSKVDYADRQAASWEKLDGRLLKIETTLARLAARLDRGRE